MRFRDIPQVTRDGNYRVNESWGSIERWIERHKDHNLNLDPDFQRGHVWTKKQQKDYVEFCLRGGKGSNELKFNCPGWMDDFRGPLELVDGKQRLQAVRSFLSNDLLVFDSICFDQFEDRMRMPHYLEFIIMVNDLKTRREVLQWYLELNSGGTPHAQSELDRVRLLLDKKS